MSGFQRLLLGLTLAVLAVGLFLKSDFVFTHNSPAVTGGPADIPAATVDISREALARLREKLRADPSDAATKAELVRALHAVASVQVAKGDLRSAQITLEDAAGVDPENSAVVASLAVIHLRLGHHQAAEDLLEDAVGRDSTSQNAYYLLGVAYYEQEKISDAIRQWTTGLQLGPHPEMSLKLDKARQEVRVHDELGELQSTHFLLRYDEKLADRQLGQQILATLETLYVRLTNELTSHPPATIAVILYPDQRYFEVTHAASWSGAVFDGKIRVPTKGLARVTPELTATLAHELTHSFMFALPGRGSPAWFNEGIAQQQEGRSAGDQKRKLAQLRQAGRLVPLANLKDSFVGLSRDSAETAYGESLSAVEHINSLFGRSSTRSILDLLSQNQNFGEAFRNVTGGSVEEFEKAWHADLDKSL